MKQIELTKLELTNYRNIDYIELNFDGNSKIIGENRIGKTNILEAIYYLLTDKLLDCSTNIALIKPLDDTSKEVRVKGTFLIQDNPTENAREITLEKQYGEDWVKTRGTTELVLKGHYCNYLYNGIKQNTLKVYNGLIAEDFGIEANKLSFDVLQMLVNPFYLGNMGESDNWKQLRATIIELVGDVTDADVFAKNPYLQAIEQDLKNFSGRTEQLKKKIDSEISGLKDSISVDTAQIKLLEETPNPTDEEVAIAQRGLNECEERIALINNPTVDTVSIELKKEINRLQEELNNTNRERLEKAIGESNLDGLQKEYDALVEQKNELSNEKSAALDKVFELKNDKNKLEAEFNNCKTFREECLRLLSECDEKLKNVKVETECPTCHRPYDTEMVEKHRLESIRATESEKSSILSRGKENRSKMLKIQQDFETKTTELKEQEKVVQDLNAQLDALNDKLVQARQSISDEKSKFNEIEKSDLQIELENLIEEKKTALREASDNFYKGQQDTRNLIEEEKAKQEPFKKVISDREFYLRQMANLDKARDTKVAHTQELANAEQKRELIKSFAIEKLKMLDENVSKVFGHIKFQLIKENINGGFDTICKPYIYDIEKDVSTDVTWKSGSKSERVITGIAIAECIKRELNLPNLPYLFDEGGEISTETFKTKFKTDSQIICVKIVDNVMKPTVQRI